MSKSLYQKPNKYKEAAPEKRAISELQRKLNRAKKTAAANSIKNKYLKKQILLMQGFLEKLKEEGRITQDEIVEDFGHKLKKLSLEKKKEN